MHISTQKNMNMYMYIITIVQSATYLTHIYVRMRLCMCMRICACVCACHIFSPTNSYKTPMRVLNILTYTHTQHRSALWRLEQWKVWPWRYCWLRVYILPTPTPHYLHTHTHTLTFHYISALFFFAHPALTPTRYIMYA